MQQFNHPFTMLVSGSTGSGKTEWLMRFLEHVNELCGEKISHVFYCYGELNDKILTLQRIGSRRGVRYTLHKGAPSEEQCEKISMESGQSSLIVLDDLVVGINQTFLDTLFTRGSHNWGTSVILVTQHLFNKELKNARNNCHYIVLMRNPAGELQVRNLGTQLFPQRRAYFLESYQNATKEKFSYLVIDMHPSTDEQLRLKTNIYPGELTVVYVPK